MTDFIDRIEKEMRQELAPRDAPAGFTDKVLSRISQPEEHQQGRRPFWTWVTAAALLIAVALGGYLEQRHQQRIAGERARQQVLLALRITSSTLQAVSHKVNEGRTAKEVQP